MSDPCLLSSTQEEMCRNDSSENLAGSTDDQSTNMSGEMNSLDSGILDEGYSGRGQNIAQMRESPRLYGEQVEDPRHQKSISKSRQVSQNNARGQNLLYENLRREYDKNQSELKSLRNAHGKLQKVLTDKGTELSHAVRKGEGYEREARKLRHKLEEVRENKQSEKSAFKEQRIFEKKINSHIRLNIDDFKISI